MKIISERSKNDFDVEFLDEYHYVKEHCSGQNWETGQIKNPYDKTVFGFGYIGDGKYKTRVGSKHTTEYCSWQDIIERCYVKERKELHPSYYGISECCLLWHNYQIFADWYNKHKYDIGERLHVDKDMKFPGNKIYSPKHCIILPQSLNAMVINKPNSRGLPNGILYEKGKYVSIYNHDELGRFDNLYDAFNVRARAKEYAIKQKANELKDVIPDEVYQAVMKYKVLIENDKNYIKVS